MGHVHSGTPHIPFSLHALCLPHSSHLWGSWPSSSTLWTLSCQHPPQACSPHYPSCPTPCACRTPTKLERSDPPCQASPCQSVCHAPLLTTGYDWSWHGLRTCLGTGLRSWHDVPKQPCCCCWSCKPTPDVLTRWTTPMNAQQHHDADVAPIKHQDDQDNFDQIH